MGDEANCSLRMEVKSSYKCILHHSFGCYDAPTELMWVRGGCRGSFNCHGSRTGVCGRQYFLEHTNCSCSRNETARFETNRLWWAIKDRADRNPVAAPSVRSTSRASLLFIEHVMKSGGTALCRALRLARGCKLGDLNSNCRMQGKATDDWLSAVPSGWDGPSITSADAARGFVRAPHLCNILMSEIAFEEHHSRNHTGWPTTPHFTYGPKEPFWRAFTTVLLVRDPWARFVSHVDEFRQLRGFWTRKLWLNQPSIDLDCWNVTCGKHLVEGLLSAQDYPYVRIWHNFLTSHLVAGFNTDWRLGPSACSQKAAGASVLAASVLRRALQAVDRVTLVLNPSDLPQLSETVIKAHLGLPWFSFNVVPSERRSRAGLHSWSWGATRQQRMRFDQANECDHAVVLHANSKLSFLAQQQSS